MCSKCLAHCTDETMWMRVKVSRQRDKQRRKQRKEPLCVESWVRPEPAMTTDSDKALKDPSLWTWGREEAFIWTDRVPWTWTQTLSLLLVERTACRDTDTQIRDCVCVYPQPSISRITVHLLQVFAAECFTAGQDWNVPPQHARHRHYNHLQGRNLLELLHITDEQLKRRNNSKFTTGRASHDGTDLFWFMLTWGGNGSKSGRFFMSQPELSIMTLCHIFMASNN